MNKDELVLAIHWKLGMQSLVICSNLTNQKCNLKNEKQNKYFKINGSY